MRTTSRLFRTVLVAAGLMAVSATAAQAMAMGPANVSDRDPAGFPAAGLMAVTATAAQAMAMGPANVSDRDPAGFPAAGLMAVSATAADGFTAAHHQLPVVSHSPGGPVVLHKSGFVLGHQLSFAAPQPMAAAADSPTNQTAPPVIAQPVSAQSVDNGFDWRAAALGAFVASLLLILAAVAATIVRPRQTVQL
jgi:hypothetical protein